MKFTSSLKTFLVLKLDKLTQLREIPPKRAARGKIILTLTVHTIFYHDLKFHEIVRLIKKIRLISLNYINFTFPPKLPPP